MSDLSLSGVCMLAALTVTMWPSQGYWQQWQQPLYSANPMPQQTGMCVCVCVCGVGVCVCVGGWVGGCVGGWVGGGVCVCVCGYVCVCVWVCGIYHHVCEDVEQKVRSMKCRREVFNVLVSSITELSIWKYTVTLSSTRPK